jgi:hypothetical protein
MIILTSDKLTMVKTGFSIRDSIYQGPKRSTPCQMAALGGFTPLERQSKAV